MGKAFSRAATVETAVNGFKKCGIYPFNRNVFRDSDFTIQEDENGSSADSPTSKSPASVDQPSTSGLVSPADISPPPVMRRRNISNGRSGKATLITGSPYKKELQKSTSRTVQLKGKTITENKRQSPSTNVDCSADSDDEDEHDAECIYCSGLFSKDKRGEKWLRCTKCMRWCHEKCADVNDWKHFACAECLQC